MLGCGKRVGAIAVLDVVGAEEQCARVEALAERARAAWRLEKASEAVRVACKGTFESRLPLPVRELAGPSCGCR